MAEGAATDGASPCRARHKEGKEPRMACSVEANGKRYQGRRPWSYISVLMCRRAKEIMAVRDTKLLVRDSTGDDVMYVPVGSRVVIGKAPPGDRVTVTPCDDQGNPIVGKDGKTHTWTARRDLLDLEYDLAHMTEEGVASPRGNVQHLVQVDRDSAFLVFRGGQGEELMPIDAGGWLNGTSRRMHGVSEEELEASYEILEHLPPYPDSEKARRRWLRPEAGRGKGQGQEGSPYAMVRQDAGNEGDGRGDEATDQ